MSSEGPRIAKVPLLIWVDDEVYKKQELREYAIRLGLNLCIFTSTADATTWINENLDFLKANDDGTKVRVLTDQAREEPRPEGRGIWNNPHAGEDLVIYIRCTVGLHMPILVYTGEVGLPITRYVKKIQNAGSTRSRLITRNYIAGLGHGNQDTSWMGFNAGGMKLIDDSESNSN